MPSFILNTKDPIAEKYRLLQEELLTEGRIDFLKKQYDGKLTTEHDPGAQFTNTDDIVDHFASADPTKKKVYTQWILNQYQRSGMSPDELAKRKIQNQPHLKQEDTGRVERTLSDFDKYQSKLPEKDINKYDTLEHVEDAVRPFLGQATSKAEATKTLNHPGLEKKWEDPHVAIFELKDKQASKDLFGGGCANGKTEWCTADTRDNYNRYDYYNEQGPLHVVLNKQNGKKYQYHVASEQFMNEKDEPITDEEFSEIAPSFHKALDEQPALWREKH